MSGKKDVADRTCAKPTNDFVFTRTFRRVLNAPRELVFEAWSDPEHLADWWGPRGFTTTTSEFDLRPGGLWRFVMHGPDGVDHMNRIMFVEVLKPERLVYKHASDDAESVTFNVTVTFAEEGGNTRLKSRILFPAAARTEVVKKYGAIEGAYQTLDRLGEKVAAMARA